MASDDDSDGGSSKSRLSSDESHGRDGCGGGGGSGGGVGRCDKFNLFDEGEEDPLSLDQSKFPVWNWDHVRPWVILRRGEDRMKCS